MKLAGKGVSSNAQISISWLSPLPILHQVCPLLEHVVVHLFVDLYMLSHGPGQPGRHLLGDMSGDMRYEVVS